jgi:hypothetical protein
LRLSAGARDRRIEYRSTLIGAAFSAAEPSRAALTAAGPGAGSRPQPLAAEADHGGALPADGDPAVPPADVVQAQPGYLACPQPIRVNNVRIVRSPRPAAVC